jgi:anaerobic magnesium-protoporphyrin IX monomethyl ester cyclase
MKIALISTPSRTYAPNYIPPLGLMYLAAHLRNLGHSVTIIDIAKTRQPITTTLNELEQYQPDLIAISAIITAYRFVKHLVKDLKHAFPKKPVVIGGHITLDNVDLLINEIGVDYVIEGYGELKIAALADYLASIRPINEIPGLSYLLDGRIITNAGDLFYNKIDEAPLPAYDLVDMEYYATVTKSFPKLEAHLKKTNKPSPPLRALVVIGARGCTDRCSFCVHEFEHYGFKFHSIDYIMENIRVLYEQYGIRIFQMGEDLFLFNPRQAQAFVNAMNEKFPDAYFQCSTRADYITPEMIRIVQQSNCFTLGFGFESGNDYILNILGKRMTRQTNLKAYSLVAASDITPACSFMVGTPGETQSSIHDTILAIREGKITDSAVFITTPYPGARIYRWCIENNYIRNRSAYLDFVSDRDAVKLSINLTPYPDIIVKCMKIMVENALEVNKTEKVPSYRIPLFRRIVYHRIVPAVYTTYFSMRSVLGIFSTRFRKERIDYELNKKGTLKISMDRE